MTRERGLCERRARPVALPVPGYLAAPGGSGAGGRPLNKGGAPGASAGVPAGEGTSRFGSRVGRRMRAPLGARIVTCPAWMACTVMPPIRVPSRATTARPPSAGTRMALRSAPLTTTPARRGMPAAAAGADSDMAGGRRLRLNRGRDNAVAVHCARSTTGSAEAPEVAICWSLPTLLAGVRSPSSSLPSSSTATAIAKRAASASKARVARPPTPVTAARRLGS